MSPCPLLCLKVGGVMSPPQVLWWRRPCFEITRMLIAVSEMKFGTLSLAISTRHVIVDGTVLVCGRQTV